MSFRKKHKEESEVFTDSLNDILFILLMFFLIVATLANPNIVPVHNPKGDKEGKAKQDVTVSINKDQELFIGNTRIENRAAFDSLLLEQINMRRAKVDTPTVVINADSSSLYGEVFRIMRVAKTNKATKVVAMVKQ